MHVTDTDRGRRIDYCLRGLILLVAGSVGPHSAQAAAPPPIRTIVTLGDSITKGVRPGVAADQTFAAILQKELRAQGIATQVLNLGIGGERTDQALQRLSTVVEHHPAWVTVMYGTNDSYVDAGQSASRLTVDAYRTNLRQLVTQLLLAGVEPILMTEPRWAPGARNGLDEDPNVRLEPFMDACRAVAREHDVPLIDHFVDWTTAAENGTDLEQWTTDRCHPNALGHQQLAAAILPVLQRHLAANVRPVELKIELQTVLEHDDRHFLWFHPRPASIPVDDDERPPVVLMTLQKHLLTSDHYSGLHVLETTDLGHMWTGPRSVEELAWRRDGDVDVAVADVTPVWLPAAKKVLATGAQVRYSATGQQLEDRPRSHQTAYALYDPATRCWTRWRQLAMPDDERFNFARCACAQFLVEPDGTLLLPLYIARSATVPFEVTVARCRLEQDELKFLEHGDILSLPVVRGLCEPSLVHWHGRYFLTIRNDLKGYVTRSHDGLHYRPIKPWLFDDGVELGSYNTQQHWLAHRDGLFLAYTRRGADNDHIFRHRAPLFLAQVDPDALQVLRATERVLVPERGATLGNFGAARISDHESWVTVAEGLWNEEARSRGGRGAVFVARVIWQTP